LIGSIRSERPFSKVARSKSVTGVGFSPNLSSSLKLKRNIKMPNGKGHDDPQPDHGKDDKGHHGRDIPTPRTSSAGPSMTKSSSKN
jgi:hypothetical protein